MSAQKTLEVYPLWGRDLPCGSHCSGTLELLPPKAVCLRTPSGGPFCHMQAGVITPAVDGADMHRGGVG